MKKKALIVANMGGFASFLISDIDMLHKMGYEVTYVANMDALPWEDTKNELLKRNVRNININFDTKNPFSKQNRKAYIELKEILKENYYDLIHCHTPIVGFLTRIAARKTRRNGSKIIYTTHGFAFTDTSSKKSWLIFYNFEKFSSRFCDAIITINKEDYKNAKKMHCKNVYYINGVGVDIKKYIDVDINIEQYKTKLEIDKDKIVILSVGELSERKNHKIIIDAIAKLENKSKYIYIICGNGVDGGTAEKLKSLAKEKEVDLKLLGFRYDIPQIIKCSDIGAIPSIREGLGLAGIQSLAEGIPLVASNVQGIKDYVIDGETGYLSSPFDSNQFAENINKLTSKEIRSSMSDKCKEVAKQFDISISINQRKEIYEQILGE